METYIEGVKKQYSYYKHLGDQTLERLSEEQLFWKYNDESNSIAAIVKHMWGNMLSRWTDFLTTDGEKEWRQRDAEFEHDVYSKVALLEIWEAGWKCLFDALESLTEDDLNKTIFIRNQGHSVTDAINRQLAHYAYHVGQMVFVGKMLLGENWASLSIPKGDSIKFNTEKFSKEKVKVHFTEEFLKSKK